MKRLYVALAVVALVAGATNSTYGQAGAGATQPVTSTPSDSRSFINDLTVAGMTEVQLGKMAAEQAASPDVKAFGQMMVHDHSKAGDELKQVAAQLNVQPPTQPDKKHQDLADRLSKLSGAEFDREYMNAMVQGHEEVLGKVRSRAGSSVTPTTGSGAVGTTGSVPGGEQALTQWATKALPTVQRHLARARELQQKVAK
jgi:putative membrane protein